MSSPNHGANSVVLREADDHPRYVSAWEEKHGRIVRCLITRDGTCLVTNRDVLGSFLPGWTGERCPFPDPRLVTGLGEDWKEAWSEFLVCLTRLRMGV